MSFETTDDVWGDTLLNQAYDLFSQALNEWTAPNNFLPEAAPLAPINEDCESKDNVADSSQVSNNEAGDNHCITEPSATPTHSQTKAVLSTPTEDCESKDNVTDSSQVSNNEAGDNHCITEPSATPTHSQTKAVFSTPTEDCESKDNVADSSQVSNNEAGDNLCITEPSATPTQSQTKAVLSTPTEDSESKDNVTDSSQVSNNEAGDNHCITEPSATPTHSQTKAVFSTPTEDSGSQHNVADSRQQSNDRPEDNRNISEPSADHVQTEALPSIPIEDKSLLIVPNTNITASDDEDDIPLSVIKGINDHSKSLSNGKVQAVSKTVLKSKNTSSPKKSMMKTKKAVPVTQTSSTNTAVSQLTSNLGSKQKSCMKKVKSSSSKAEQRKPQLPTRSPKSKTLSSNSPVSVKRFSKSVAKLFPNNKSSGGKTSSTSDKQISSVVSAPVTSKVTDKLTPHKVKPPSSKGIKRGTNSVKEVSPAKLARHEANDLSSVAVDVISNVGDHQQSSIKKASSSKAEQRKPQLLTLSPKSKTLSSNSPVSAIGFTKNFAKLLPQNKSSGGKTSSTSDKQISSVVSAPVTSKVTDKLTPHKVKPPSSKGIKRGTNSVKEVSPAKLARHEANDLSSVAVDVISNVGDHQQSSAKSGTCLIPCAPIETTEPSLGTSSHQCPDSEASSSKNSLKSLKFTPISTNSQVSVGSLSKAGTKLLTCNGSLVQSHLEKKQNVLLHKDMNKIMKPQEVGVNWKRGRENNVTGQKVTSSKIMKFKVNHLSAAPLPSKSGDKQQSLVNGGAGISEEPFASTGTIKPSQQCVSGASSSKSEAGKKSLGIRTDLFSSRGYSGGETPSTSTKGRSVNFTPKTSKIKDQLTPHQQESLSFEETDILAYPLSPISSSDSTQECPVSDLLNLETDLNSNCKGLAFKTPTSLTESGKFKNSRTKSLRDPTPSGPETPFTSNRGSTPQTRSSQRKCSRPCYAETLAESDGDGDGDFSASDNDEEFVITGLSKCLEGSGDDSTGGSEDEELNQNHNTRVSFAVSKRKIQRKTSSLHSTPAGRQHTSIPGPSSSTGRKKSACKPASRPARSPDRSAARPISDEPTSLEPSEPTAAEYNWEDGDLLQQERPCPAFDDPDSIQDPIDYFRYFWDDEFFESLATQTNLYSTWRKDSESLNVSKKEMEAFIGMWVYMGICTLPSYEDYWSVCTRVPQIASIMTLKRYEKIRSRFHLADNDAPDDGDLLRRVRPLLDQMRQKCNQLEQKENQYSIDESMILYKGKKAKNLRQYMPNKPHKWGFKFHLLCGVTGIVYDFLPYTGADTFANEDLRAEAKELGIGGQVVVALSKSIALPHLSVVCFDNYFTSIPLLKYLKDKMGILSIGTIRSNRTKHCPLKSDTDLKNEGRGSHDVKILDDSIACIKWVDNKVVSLASSYVGVTPIGTVERWNKDDRNRVPVPCPKIVKDYNAMMGGVDHFDMLVELYRTSTRAKRWYIPIVGFMISMALVNSWLLYHRDFTALSEKQKELHPSQPAMKKEFKNSKEFRLHIFSALVAPQRRGKGRPSAAADVPKPSNPIKSPVLQRPPREERRDQYGHFPGFAEKRGRCRNCRDGFSDIKCLKCDMVLCLNKKRNCFVHFHQ